MTSALQSDLTYLEPRSESWERIVDFVQHGIDLEESPDNATESEFWNRVAGNVPTGLWLDSGDIDAIDGLWNTRFDGLTTNNTLLNREVQKGVYDDLVPQANERLPELPFESRIREIGFILNLRHALRLVHRFRCQVSVELHTDLAYDTAATVAFARRCHRVCPGFFVVKIPFTAEGLIATRILRGEGIEVNCTLGFGARQNYIATALASPSYVNVFLGRLNSLISDNDLGDGRLVGEKATLASQQEVSVFTRGLPRVKTKQIAASLRDAEQLPRLAGVDVITMPAKVAEQAEQARQSTWQSQLNEEYEVSIQEDVDTGVVDVTKLWDVTKRERNLAQKAILNPPADAEELRQMAIENEVPDLFPELSQDDWDHIHEDGKVPRLKHWMGRLAQGDLALDSLMNAAGMSSFMNSQQELDQRIKEHLQG